MIKVINNDELKLVVGGSISDDILSSFHESKIAIIEELHCMLRGKDCAGYRRKIITACVGFGLFNCVFRINGDKIKDSLSAQAGLAFCCLSIYNMIEAYTVVYLGSEKL